MYGFWLVWITAILCGLIMVLLIDIFTRRK